MYTGLSRGQGGRRKKVSCPLPCRSRTARAPSRLSLDLANISIYPSLLSQLAPSMLTWPIPSLAVPIPKNFSDAVGPAPKVCSTDGSPPSTSSKGLWIWSGPIANTLQFAIRQIHFRKVRPLSSEFREYRELRIYIAYLSIHCVGGTRMDAYIALAMNDSMLQKIQGGSVTYKKHSCFAIGEG